MKKNKIIISTVILCLCLIVGLVILKQSHPRTEYVTIEGLTDCSKNISKETQDDISIRMYKLLKSANDYNKLSTARSYEAVVRKGSCKNESKPVTDNSNGRQVIVRTTNIIVDTPDAKQSWKIAYDWVTKGSKTTNIDLGTIQSTCLPKDQLIYGDFKCENILSLAQYGTDKADPILRYMPYSGAGFEMDYDPDTKTVSILIVPPPGTKDIAAFKESTIAIIPYWFQKRSLDQSKYTIVYTGSNDSPDDGSDDN